MLQKDIHLKFGLKKIFFRGEIMNKLEKKISNESRSWITVQNILTVVEVKNGLQK